MRMKEIWDREVGGGRGHGHVVINSKKHDSQNSTLKLFLFKISDVYQQKEYHCKTLGVNVNNVIMLPLQSQLSWHNCAAKR